MVCFVVCYIFLAVLRCVTFKQHAERLDCIICSCTTVPFSRWTAGGRCGSRIGQGSQHRAESGQTRSINTHDFLSYLESLVPEVNRCVWMHATLASSPTGCYSKQFRQMVVLRLELFDKSETHFLLLQS